MAVEVAFGELIPEDIDGQFKILSDMLDPKNIDMKTEIHNPVTFAILESICINIEKLVGKINNLDVKLPRFKAVLDKIIEKIKTLMVSYARKSRGEIKEILQGIRNEVQASRTFMDRLLNTGR